MEVVSNHDPNLAPAFWYGLHDLCSRLKEQEASLEKVAKEQPGIKPGESYTNQNGFERKFIDPHAVLRARALLERMAKRTYQTLADPNCDREKQLRTLMNVERRLFFGMCYGVYELGLYENLHLVAHVERAYKEDLGGVENSHFAMLRDYEQVGTEAGRAIECLLNESAGKEAPKALTPFGKVYAEWEALHPGDDFSSEFAERWFEEAKAKEIHTLLEPYIDAFPHSKTVTLEMLSLVWRTANHVHGPARKQAYDMYKETGIFAANTPPVPMARAHDAIVALLEPIGENPAYATMCDDPQVLVKAWRELKEELSKLRAKENQP